jgi:hypothetical protein
MESDGEQVELLLREALSPDAVVERLQPLLPDGMEIVACHASEEHPLSRRLRSLRMRVEFATAPGHDSLDVGAACRELLARDSLVVVRTGKKRPREREVRPSLLALRPLPSLNGTRAVEVTLGTSGPAIKAEELVRELGGDPATCRGRRLGFDVAEPGLATVG